MGELVVRFNRMVSCIIVWLLLDIVMIAYGSSLPEWLQFDGRDAFRRDIWVVIFIAWMWFNSERRPSPRGAE